MQSTTSVENFCLGRNVILLSKGMPGNKAIAVAAFKVYLLGRSFVIQTDHRSLERLDKLKDNNPRLCRWSLALQPYQYSVIYRASDKNADAFSRVTR